MPINTDPLVSQQPFKPSPILDAPPLTEGHTGKEALYFAAQSKGWPTNRKTCETILTEFHQCRLKLQADHPAKASPLHISEGKTLWSIWQIDYIGPFKSSVGY
uniref:Uncharacterized protein n=1 Tax=Aquila chrysaetos chrysaetos TaxID=223781 RepID=A0A663E0U5_AQUCH